MKAKVVMSVEPAGSDDDLWRIRGVFGEIDRRPFRWEEERHENYLSYTSRESAERGIIENYMFGYYFCGSNIYRQIADIAMRMHDWKDGGILRGRSDDYLYWLIDYARARWADGDIA